MIKLSVYKTTIDLHCIEQLIIYIQNKIYNAANKCNTLLISQLQNYCLKKQELFLVIILKIINVFIKQYKINHEYFYKLLMYLYFTICYQYQHDYDVVNFIKHKIHQCFLNLILEPEWIPKYEFTMLINNKQKYTLDFIQRMNNFFKYKKKQIYQCLKLNLSKQLINKKNITPIIKINNKISCYLKYHINLEKTWLWYFIFPNSDNIVYDNQYNFYIVFYYISHIGLEWCLYIEMKIKNIYIYFLFFYQLNHLIFIINNKYIEYFRIFIFKFIYQLNLNIYSSFFSIFKLNYLMKNFDCSFNYKSIKTPNQFYVNSVLRDIRYILYRKNYKNLWKINTLIDINQAKYQIFSILDNWYTKHVYILNYKDVLNINKTINNMFYIWQNKR